MKEPCKTMRSSNMRDIYVKGFPKVTGLSSRELGLKSTFLTPAPASAAFLSSSAMMSFLRLLWPRPSLCWEWGGHLHGGGLLGSLQRWEQRRGRPGSGVLDIGDHAVQWGMGVAMGAHLVLSLLLAVEFPLARPEGCQMASKGKSIL